MLFPKVKIVGTNLCKSKYRFCPRKLLYTQNEIKTLVTSNKAEVLNASMDLAVNKILLETGNRVMDIIP